jgi:TonB-linked SusC/RagA family outer membrane protein
MRFRLLRGLLVGGTIAALGVMNAAPLQAQQVVINGRVTTTTGEPLGGANITVSGSDSRGTSAENGNYSLTIGSATGGTATLTARFIGYKPQSRTVTLRAGTQEQNFQLERDPFRLEEVVVTGTAEATTLRKTTFTVGRVNEEQLQEVPGASALVAVQGKISAVRLVPTSSQPGGDVALRLRGATSISGRQDPLIIVDGVITQFGLADMAPEDIERVEIIKGAAASSLYGSNAANGVVQVFTKRGGALPDGALRVTTRIEVGSNNMPKKMEFSKAHAWHLQGSAGGTCSAKGLALDDPTTAANEGQVWTVDPVGNYCLNTQGGRIVEAGQVADNPFVVSHNHWDEVVKGGVYTTQYASVGQRRGPTNFNASLQNTRNEGVIFGVGGYTRQNYRLNLDQRLRSNVDGAFSAFFGKSTNGRTAEGQDGPFFGLMFVQPDVDLLATNPDGSPFRAKVPLSGDVANDFNPLYELANRKISQDRNRFSGSSRLRWRMNNWLSAEGSFGYDQESDGYKDFFPFGYLDTQGNRTDGSLVRSSADNSQFNAGATLTSIRSFFNDQVTNTTKIGATFEDQQNIILGDTASILKVQRVPEFASAERASLAAFSTDERIRTQNYLGITTFDIKDRYILDGLIRRDASSLFGPQSRWATYYRGSAAWRVSEDFNVPLADEFRLRASYGTAGLRPEFDYQYEILQITSSGFSKDILGNPLLKPAHSAEMELGTNMEFGDGRYTFEYTFARKNTKDQIILVDLPAVAGFTRQWQNTGALKSTTHEASIGAQLWSSGNKTLTLNIVGDKTKQLITEWLLPERLYSFEQMPAAFFLGNNSDLGVIYGNKWITSIDQLYDDPAKAAARGPGQDFDPANFMINEEGYVVRKDQYGTLNEKAIKYITCKTATATGCSQTTDIVEIGNANPDFNLSFNPTLKWNQLSINGLLDWSQGGDLYNGTRQWAFQATRDRVQDQSGKPLNAASCPVERLDAADAAEPMLNPTTGACPRKTAGYYAVGFYNGLSANDFFVEDGSYVKLKEFSVHYNFQNSQLRTIGLGRIPGARVGLIGRNLLTFTKYSGLDPEVSGLFGDPFQVRMDWFQYPQFRTLSAVVEFTF